MGTNASFNHLLLSPPVLACCAVLNASLSSDWKAALLALNRALTISFIRAFSWETISWSLWSPHHQHVCWYVMSPKILKIDLVILDSSRSEHLPVYALKFVLKEWCGLICPHLNSLTLFLSAGSKWAEKKVNMFWMTKTRLWEGFVAARNIHLIKITSFNKNAICLFLSCHYWWPHTTPGVHFMILHPQECA